MPGCPKIEQGTADIRVLLFSAGRKKRRIHEVVLAQERRGLTAGGEDEKLARDGGALMKHLLRRLLKRGHGFDAHCCAV